jgi:Putative prokaryotic signal transducing protein
MYDGGVVKGDSMKSAHDREVSLLVTIREFGEMSEALLAQGCLQSAGIESFLADANIARLEWRIVRGVRLQVDAVDAETAVSLLQKATFA